MLPPKDKISLTNEEEILAYCSAKVQSLTEAAQPLAEKAQAKAGGGDNDGDGFTDAANAGATNTDDVVDADFEEVEDDKKDK